MNIKRTLFLILVTGIYYLLIAFIVGGFDILALSIAPGRFLLVCIYCIIIGVLIAIMVTDRWLESVPREEKVRGRKHY